jgi:preprotein translocase YajC subunit
VNASAISFLAQEQPEGGASFLPMMVMMLVIFVVFMFFMSRSKKRQEAQHKKMVESLEAGTRVMLNSGLIAKVDKIDAENQEARLVIDEDKKVHAIYSLMAIAKIFDEKKVNEKAD